MSGKKRETSGSADEGKKDVSSRGRFYKLKLFPIQDGEKLLHPLDTNRHSQQRWDSQIILFVTLSVPSIRVFP